MKRKAVVSDLEQPSRNYRIDIDTSIRKLTVIIRTREGLRDSYKTIIRWDAFISLQQQKSLVPVRPTTPDLTA